MGSPINWLSLAEAEAPPGLMLTAERQIPTAGGAVFHAIKQTSAGFGGFGEAYFSMVDEGSLRDWKCHTRMTLNLVVPVGRIAFFLARRDGMSWSRFHYTVLGPKNYSRLTVSPGWFMTFAGLGPGSSVLMNVADMMHDPGEAERLDAGSGPKVPALDQLKGMGAVQS
jgi:dTDP-4-dehydrorhamnose 3,5-epimerase